MDPALERFGDPRRREATRRAVASMAAALACAVATEGTALLTSELLIDGAAVTAAWSVARLAVWVARALRRVVRAAVAA